jgi:hypothetical protein
MRHSVWIRFGGFRGAEKRQADDSEKVIST